MRDSFRHQSFPCLKRSMAMIYGVVACSACCRSSQDMWWSRRGSCMCLFASASCVAQNMDDVLQDRFDPISGRSVHRGSILEPDGTTDRAYHIEPLFRLIKPVNMQYRLEGIVVAMVCSSNLAICSYTSLNPTSLLESVTSLHLLQVSRH
jgi:hypothetical protein